MFDSHATEIFFGIAAVAMLLGIFGVGVLIGLLVF